MHTEPTNVEKLRGLPWSYTTNAFNTVFSQFTYFGSVFILFLDQLGLSKADIGFVLSLIPFSNLLALWIAPWTAHFGYKRSFVLFFGLRKVITFLLLLTPLVVANFGARPAFFFVASVVGLFAAFRTVEETAYYPWYQEFVPNAVRGKYSATSNIVTALVGVLSVAVAGYVIERSQNLIGFMALITVGVFFGLGSTWAASRIPGGAPAPSDPANTQPKRDLRESLRDPDFLRYLIGLALITLSTAPVASFLPLFLDEKIGLSAGNVILVQMGTLIGTIASSYLWGWAADRYGGRPPMLIGVGLFVIMPLLWWLMPRSGALVLPIALTVAFIQGLANLGWGIGATRLLFGSVVPMDKRNDYLAVWFAWAGITAGFSQVAGGWILDWAHGVSFPLFVFTIDQYAILFAVGVVTALLSIPLLSGIRDAGSVGVGQFAGIFLRGNPFMAMTSLVKYYSARDEQATVLTTARLANAGSRLAVEEMLEALADPRFQVRFEAIISTARMPPDARLIEALGKILDGNNPALSVIAAWALGRMDHAAAQEPLQHGLKSRYRSVQAHSVRALGKLGDVRIIPRLLKGLRSEQDAGLMLAYASALGNLRATSTTGKLLDLLHANQDASDRLELTLALARMVGNEAHFIQLWRALRGETTTAAARAVVALKKKSEKTNPTQANALDRCAETLARGDLDAGARLLGSVIANLAAAGYGGACTAILHECALRLAETGAGRREYLLLALHTLDACW
ncbi:MAG: MFS transporter [Chloroflexota bacterium]|nr:MFS transporter [Chloroflexota bacterium]